MGRCFEWLVLVVAGGAVLPRSADVRSDEDKAPPRPSKSGFRGLMNSSSLRVGLLVDSCPTVNFSSEELFLTCIFLFGLLGGDT